MSYLLRIEKQYLKFSSAHFTLFPPLAGKPDAKKREMLHGHNYQVSIELEANTLKDGFVVDFVPLKGVAVAICNDLDERVLLPENIRIQAEHDETGVRIVVDDCDEFRFPNAEVTFLPVENITCETLAWYVCQQLLQKRGEWDAASRVSRLCVWVEETPGQRGGFEASLA